jgi:ferredoxin-nitrite reductase
MGAPPRKEIDGKSMAVCGCKIFVDGKIGEQAHLAMEPIKSGIPLDDESLLPVLVEILKSEFGATDKKERGLFSKLRAKIPGSK